MSNEQDVKVGKHLFVSTAEFLEPMIGDTVYIKTSDGLKVAASVVGAEGTKVKLKVTQLNTRYPLD